MDGAAARTRRWLILATGGVLLLAVSFGPVQAGQVYKCTDANGKSQFSDLPCTTTQRADTVRTVESVIGGSGTGLWRDLEQQEQARQEVQQRMGGVANDPVQVQGRVSKSSGNRAGLCALARKEYQDAKRNLRCWVSPSCESDHTRELFRRAERACGPAQSGAE